jgi:hypothetical protein
MSGQVDTHPRSVEKLANQHWGNQVVAEYYISDQIVATTSYYGYLRRDGAWYIMKAVDAGSGEINYTYAKGAGGYDWAQRAAQSYAAFSTTFALSL